MHSLTALGPLRLGYQGPVCLGAGTNMTCLMYVWCRVFRNGQRNGLCFERRECAAMFDVPCPVSVQRYVCDVHVHVLQLRFYLSAETLSLNCLWNAWRVRQCAVNSSCCAAATLSDLVTSRCVLGNFPLPHGNSKYSINSGAWLRRDGSASCSRLSRLLHRGSGHCAGA